VSKKTSSDDRERLQELIVAAADWYVLYEGREKRRKF
jgi:hypothetical protein